MTSSVKESFENVSSKRSVKKVVASSEFPEERISPTTTNIESVDEVQFRISKRKGQFKEGK